MNKLLIAAMDVLKETYDPLYTPEMNRKRGEVLGMALRHTGGNVARSLDALMIADPVFREEFNYLAKKNNPNVRTLDYSYTLGAAYQNQLRQLRSAYSDDEVEAMEAEADDIKSQYQRAGGVMDTTTNPGGANFLQTTVADFVAETVENLGLVASQVTIHDLENDGNFKIPVYDGFVKSQFVADGANFPNLGGQVEADLSSITLDPQKVGGYLQAYQSFITKITPGRLQYLLKVLADAQARAYDDAILNGTGTNSQPTGMNLNATTVTAGGDEFETLSLAISTVSDARKGDKRNLRIFGNTPIAQKYIRLRYTMTNDDRAGLIGLDASGNLSSLASVPFVETNVIESIGSSPNKNAVATVGYANMYHWGNAKRPIIETSDVPGFLSGTATMKVSGQANGKPAFDNAFAKFVVEHVV